ncbi:MAG: NAD(P)/FAD-dependent oxidoreductase [Phycisphaerae bacterium]|jgi:flavin-dependent dehydrogenase
MSDETYDVAVIGAGPAGTTAATMLKQRGRNVVMVDRATFPRETVCAGWLNIRVAPILTELGVNTKGLLDHPFNKVTFHRPDFSQTAAPKFEEIPGYIIDRATFDHALVNAAIEQEVEVMQGCQAVNLRLKEASVVVELADGNAIESTLLVLASGRSSPLVEQTGVALSGDTQPVYTAQVSADLPPEIRPSEPHVGLILGLDANGSFGFCCVSPRRASVSLSWRGEPRETRSVLFDIARHAFENQLVPLDLSNKVHDADVLPSPASAALDMDSHVGKHTLVIGDAGGFVSASSNEGLFPAMWSAQIAVEVLDKALQSVHSQDELMTFDSVWRMQMADYLRSPHTDIRFLLPLIFTNQPMADRMGAAFFAGENI